VSGIKETLKISPTSNWKGNRLIFRYLVIRRGGNTAFGCWDKILRRRKWTLRRRSRTRVKISASFKGK